MFRRLVACLLLAAGALAPTPCSAQSRIDYFGGYRYSGSPDFNGAGYPFAYAPGSYGLGYSPYGWDYGLGGPRLDYGSFGYNWFPSYNYGGYGSAYPGGITSRYYSPAVPSARETETRAQPRNDNAAHLRLIVPENAQLWFEGQKTSQKGRVRNFVSPPLTPGTTYNYSVRIRYTGENGREVEKTQSIAVQANDWRTIDLTQPASETSPSTPPAAAKR
jgi:uncharacterized protein (TIGR03000 family)